MNRLEGIKVGDIIYHVTKGEVIVEEITDDEIEVSLKNHRFTYTSEGYMFKRDIHPSLFRNRNEVIEYFSNLQILNTEEELKKLETIEFDSNQNNYILYWNYEHDRVGMYCYKNEEFPNTIYFKGCNNLYQFAIKCNENGITKEQFFEAYKNVFGGK